MTKQTLNPSQAIDAYVAIRDWCSGNCSLSQLVSIIGTDYSRLTSLLYNNDLITNEGTPTANATPEVVSWCILYSSLRVLIEETRFLLRGQKKVAKLGTEKG
jgi:hypothetical protein